MNNNKRLSRRHMLKEASVVLAALGWAAATGFAKPASAQDNDRETAAQGARRSAPKGPGSVSGAPGLSSEFRRTFSSRYIQANGLRQHVVIGGEGPPLLLVHGWPETWYAWRLLMPALARDFTVIAVDQRGIGLTDKPQDGYDAGTLASDLVALMDALGHQQFAVVGHDTGYIISYALAADYPARVARVALAEIPGPPLPPPLPGPELFVPEPLNNRLWHIPFNRVNDPLTEQLVRGREKIFFGYEFAIQTGDGRKLPDSVVDYYVGIYSNRDALRGCFGLYRAWDATLDQNKERVAQPLAMPVLAIGGAASWGDLVGNVPANDVQTVVIPGTGHWVAETAPEEMLAALSAFLAPYRDAVTTVAR